MFSDGHLLAEAIIIFPIVSYCSKFPVFPLCSSCMKPAQTHRHNDVNWAAVTKGSRPASGRGRTRAPSVVIQRKPVSKLDVRATTRIGTWNVRSLLEPGASRLLVDELEAAHVAIMGLQEVRWSQSGETAVGNYHLLWSGPPEGQPRFGGVALALNPAAYSALKSWFPVSNRLLVAKLQHRFGTLSVVVAYAPTNEASDDDKDDFYASLEQAMQLVNTNDLVLCLGDFNAESGTARDSTNVVGPYGFGTDNNNSQRLRDFCIGANLRICGSWFQRRDIHRFSWLSNDHKTAKEIDHVLVSHRWNIITNCRVYRKPEFDTDHRPVVATCALKLRKQCTSGKPNRRFDVNKLRLPAVEPQYQIAIRNWFAVLSHCDDRWETFKDAHSKTAEEILELRKFTRHEWISSKTRILVEEKRSARLCNDKDKYVELNKQCKMSVRRDKQEWAEKKAAQSEAEIASGQTKDAFAHFRSLKSACPRIVSPIFDTNGKLVSDKSAKSKRWKEHFEQLLNHPPVTVPNLPAGPREDDVQLCSVPSLACLLYTSDAADE